MKRPLKVGHKGVCYEAETGKDSEEIIEEQIQVITPPPAISKEVATFINPYLTGRPVQSPEMFFGRRDILEWIKKRLCANNIIILYGQRRTGKTSTLFQLKNVVYKDTAVPVFLTLQSVMGSDRNLFFFHMANDLYKSIKDKTNLSPPEMEDFKTDPQYQLELFLETAVKKIKDKPIIYLIDEFDGLFQMIKEKRMEPSVLDNLRSIVQHFQQVWFLLAGTHALKHAAADYQSALFNIATFEKIGSLDEKDAKDLVTKPLAEHIEYEPYAVDKIISLTNCHPYFIQVICFELVFYLETNQLHRVTVKEVNLVVDEILKKGSSHFDHYWEYLTEAEQRFLSLLAENIKEYESFISMDRARDFCQGKFKPGVDIYKLISGLIEKDLLLEKKYRDKRHIGFFMDFFKRWILMHHPSDDYQ
jgi:hemerythrin